MSPQPTTRLPAAESRRRIEEAAILLFAERGYSQTTVEDVVGAAGVTKPILYRHFESKQDLCIALLERTREELIAAPLGRFDPQASDPAAQQALMLDVWLEYVENHPLATCLLMTPISGETELAAVQQELFGRQRATQRAMVREFAPEIPE